MALHYYHHWAFPTGAVYLCSAAPDMTGNTESGPGKLSLLSVDGEGVNWTYCFAVIHQHHKGAERTLNRLTNLHK